MSSSNALPLSVDQRDAFASPTNRTTYGGNEPTSSAFGFSTGGSAFDRLDATPAADYDAYNSMPTSTDDVMMPHIEFASHPSLTGDNTTAAAAADTASPSHLAQQAKAKASSAAETVKDKAADARDKAADTTHDAKVKAVELKDSAKSKAADVTEDAKVKATELKEGAKIKAAQLQDKVEETAETIKEKLVLGAEKVKEEGRHLLSFAKSSLHSAEERVEDGYEQVKDKIESRRAESQAASSTRTSAPNASASTAPVIKSTAEAETTTTHPLASSMRDRDAHQPLSGWASHANEIPTRASDVHMTDAHQRALRAGEEAHARALATHSGDDKDVSANPIQGWSMLQKVHDKLEDGAEAIKEKVDGFVEEHVRSDSTHHMSAAKVDDIPTLIDTSNHKNVTNVRAKYHPSAERTIAGHNQDE